MSQSDILLDKAYNVQCQLRRKLEPNPAHSTYIITVLVSVISLIDDRLRTPKYLISTVLNKRHLYHKVALMHF